MSVVYNFLLENHLIATIERVATKRKTTLNLSSFEIKSLPDVLYTCEDILRLYLHKNKLVSIASSIINLHALTTLTLDYNNLDSLPRELGSLPNLVNLNLSHNPLKVLMPEIGNLSNLEVLWCNRTDIEAVPREIGNLKKLDTFGARGNRIEEICEDMLHLSNLRWLTLENNSIKEIPRDIDKLKTLVHFNLRGNAVTELPISVLFCNELQYLMLNNNQITELPNNWGETKSISLEIIDLRGNPIADNLTSEQSSRCHPVIRISDEWPNRNPQSETSENPNDNNNENNNAAVASTDSTSSVINNATEDIDWHAGEILIEDENISNSDDSSEDWENSVLSSELDLTDSSHGDRQDNEMLGIFLPEISRYASTGS